MSLPFCYDRLSTKDANYNQEINILERSLSNYILNLDPIFEFKFYLSKEKIDVLHGLCNLMGCIKA